MLRAVVVSPVRAGHLLILRAVAGLGVPELVAVAVVAHICVHICLIMAQVQRGGMPVAGREMAPIPGRPPWRVDCKPQMDENGRCGYHDGFDYETGAVKEFRADDLYVAVACDGNFRHYGCHVLIDIRCKDGLDHEHVGTVFDSFQDSQVIYITVVVQVQVGEHVRAVVQQVFELFNGGRLGECRGDCLQVQTEGDVLVGGYYPRCGGHRIGPWRCDDCTVHARIVCVRGNGHNACGTACCHQHGHQDGGKIKVSHSS